MSVSCPDESAVVTADDSGAEAPSAADTVVDADVISPSHTATPQPTASGHPDPIETLSTAAELVSASDAPATRIRWVGIGASAGGLEALRSFVRKLPDDLPAVFIVAQHMAPMHKSMLADIIGRETRMEVRDVTDGLVPQPGCLYVTPPNRNIVVDGHCLKLLDPHPEPASPKPSVNLFFSTLATERRDAAIAIVLSGTGSDGAEGIKAIREHGGITCAQSELSAKYTGMPESAIETGMVDLVLSPDELGRRFADILARPDEIARLITPDIDEDAMSRIVSLLRERTAVDFSHYKIPTLQRRLERRMTAVNVADLDDYLSVVESDSKEIDALYRDLLISVTAFFRDPDEFESIREQIGALVGRKGDSPIRVWVAGCATGEEAYSLAILFAEAARERNLVNAQRLQMFATDIDDRAIEVARRGFYADALLEQVTPDLLERYFERAPGGHTVNKSLREKIVFSVHNVAQDPPFLNVDLISCRNLLIYFQTSLQARVFARFRYALVPHGLLFLGKSESAGSAENQFHPVGRNKHVFVQQPLKRRRLEVPMLMPQSNSPSMQREERAPQPNHELVAMHARFRSLVNALGPHALLVSANMQIQKAFGDIGRFIGIDTESNVSTSTMSLVREPFRQDIRAAVPAVINGGRRMRCVAHPDPQREQEQVRVVVYPIETGDHEPDQALVVFESVSTEQPVVPTRGDDSIEALRKHIAELTAELETSQRSLQQSVEELETTNEELQALNEELQASNEELQSTNEEMETANEELQSTNEELSTVNEELQVNAQQLNTLNLSLNNVLDNVGIPMLVVDRAFYVDRMSQAAGSMFAFSPDLDQPHVSRCRTPPGVPPLVPLLDEAITTNRRIDQQVSHEDFNATLSIVPYRNAANESTGAIVLLADNTEALRRTQDELQLIFDNVPVGLMVRDRDGRILKVNRWSAQRLGFSPDRLVGESFYDLLAAPSAESVRARDALVFENGIASTDDMQRVGFANGQAIWARMSRTLSTYPGHDEPMLYAVTQDITQQHEAQLAFELSELRLEQAIEASKLGLWDWNPDSGDLYWSDRLLEIAGIERGDFGSRLDAFFARLHPEDEPRVRELMNEWRRRPVTFSVGYRLRHRDGHYRWVEARGEARADDDGRITRVIGTADDVTERRQNVHVLRERNRQLDLAQAMSGIGYWRLDLDAPSMYWSEQIFHIHGLPPDDGPPELDTAIDCYHPDDRERVRASVEKATREEHAFEFEATLVRPDGSERRVQSIGQSEVDSSGRPHAIFGVFRDLTDLRAREAALQRTLEQLSRSNEELNRFSYVCSHDMKEPVRMIESMSELLLDPDISGDEERRHELVARIGRNMSRLKATIDNLLAYSRLDAKIEYSDVELEAVVAEIVDNLDPEIVKRDASIEVGTLPMVHGARTHFQQLFQNLIGNALKYSDKEAPIVRISGERDPEWVRLLVEDNGPGVPAESLQDIFQVFSRLRLQSDVEGTGLGLAICHRIVDQYGGTISARRGELGGAAFDIRLPVRPSAAGS